MKLYQWQNMYLSGPQTGIQTAHAQVGLVEKWWNHPEVQAWIKDKTTVLLKGGMHQNLQEIDEFLSMGYLPYYTFRESKEALNGAVTNVCVLPTDRLYHAASAYRTYGKNCFIEFDNNLYMVKEVFDDGDEQFVGFNGKLLRQWKDQKDMWNLTEIISEVCNESYNWQAKTSAECFTAWETEFIKRIANGRTL